jgi:hypothetical protein
MQKGENYVCVSLSVRSSSGSKLVQWGKTKKEKIGLMWEGGERSVYV